MKPTTFVLLFILLSLSAFGQYDSTQVAKLLNKVHSMQVVGDNFYSDGLFKTKRIWKDQVMEDDTFFYTASLIYILQQLQPRLNKEQQDIANEVCARALKNFMNYANRKGETSFNFWQTNPDTPHPNGKPKYQKAKHGLPDDLDDSVIIASILQNDSISKELREKMLAYAEENNDKSFKKAPKGYEKTKAYRTWFADKWKQDIDFVVLCNVLLFVFENNYPLNPYDQASIDFITQVIENSDHLSRPKELSPYYGRSVVMLYHLSRVLEKDCNGSLLSIQSQIITDLEGLLPTTGNLYERMMIYTSLYRLGQNITIAIDEKELNQSSEEFYFFYSTSANLSMPQYKLWVIQKWNLIPNMYWKSEAFNQMILLEFMITTGYSFQSDLF